VRHRLPLLLVLSDSICVVRRRTGTDQDGCTMAARRSTRRPRSGSATFAHLPKLSPYTCRPWAGSLWP